MARSRRRCASRAVPRILTVVHRSDGEPYTFAVIENMTGDCLLNSFGDAIFEIKESIIHKRIGTTAILWDGVIDLAHVVSSFKAARAFNTLEEYMESLVTQAKREPLESDRIGSDHDSRAWANKVLDHIVGEFPSIFQRLSSSSYRRCILDHDDLNETNVLVNKGDGTTGITDWEYHSVRRPVVLAAQHPCNLRYGGIWGPHLGLGAWGLGRKRGSLVQKIRQG